MRVPLPSLGLDVWLFTNEINFDLIRWPQQPPIQLVSKSNQNTEVFMISFISRNQNNWLSIKIFSSYNILTKWGHLGHSGRRPLRLLRPSKFWGHKSCLQEQIHFECKAHCNCGFLRPWIDLRSLRPDVVVEAV